MVPEFAVAAGALFMVLLEQEGDVLKTL